MSYDARRDRERIIGLLRQLTVHFHYLEDNMADIQTDVQTLADLSTQTQQIVGGLQTDVQTVIDKLAAAAGQGNLTPDQKTTMETAITVFQGVRDAMTALDAAVKSAANPPTPTPTPDPTPVPTPDQPAPPA